MSVNVMFRKALRKFSVCSFVVYILFVGTLPALGGDAASVMKGVKGCALVMDLHTGEILDGYNVSRALSFEYPSSSVLKPIVAFGALRYGVLAAKEEIDGSREDLLKEYGKSLLSYMRVDRGALDLDHAMALSDNVYFYALGARMGEEVVRNLFQSFNLVSRTSALKNVELPMIYAKMGRQERYERAKLLLDNVGLADRGHHVPSELSGGQKQRVAIARALANNPSIILADEPTGNLDSRSSLEIMEIFERLNREDGTTVIVVTHEPDIASFASRVITFRDGKLILDHKPTLKKGKSIVEKKRGGANALD